MEGELPEISCPQVLQEKNCSENMLVFRNIVCCWAPPIEWLEQGLIESIAHLTHTSACKGKPMVSGLGSIHVVRV